LGLKNENTIKNIILHLVVITGVIVKKFIKIPFYVDKLNNYEKMLLIINTLEWIKKILNALNINTELKNFSFLDGKNIITDEIKIKELDILFKKINK